MFPVDQGFILSSGLCRGFVHVVAMFALVSSGLYSFLPPPKNTHVGGLVMPHCSGSSGPDQEKKTVSEDE